jgi:RNA polymerase sigma-70 factor (ECF subfamily)
MSEAFSGPGTRPSLLARLYDAQDAEAWQTFVATYGPLIHRYGRYKGLQEADAADVTQAVLGRVLHSMRGGFKYQAERGRFRDWLGTVTYREVVRFLRRQARDPGAGQSQDDLDRLPAADQAAWTADFYGRVLQVALERIRPHFEATTWAAFDGVWLGGRSALATAEGLGLTIDAVYMAKYRVLKRLREELLLLAEDLPQCVPLD